MIKTAKYENLRRKEKDRKLQSCVYRKSGWWVQRIRLDCSLDPGDKYNGGGLKVREPGSDRWKCWERGSWSSARGVETRHHGESCEGVVDGGGVAERSGWGWRTVKVLALDNPRRQGHGHGLRCSRSSIASLPPPLPLQSSCTHFVLPLPFSHFLSFAQVNAATDPPLVSTTPAILDTIPNHPLSDSFSDSISIVLYLRPPQTIIEATRNWLCFYSFYSSTSLSPFYR